MKLTKSEVMLMRLVFGVFLLFVLFSAIQSQNIIDWIYLFLVCIIEIMSFIKRR